MPPAPVPPIEVRDADPDRALTFLAALEARSGVPAVDEDEQHRLAGRPPLRDPGWDWAGHLVTLAGSPVAYAGIRIPPDGTGGCAARVDLAVDRDHADAQPALAAALEHLRSHALRGDAAGHEGDARPVEAWLRGASSDDLTTAAQVGFRERSRLHVLGVGGFVARPPAQPEVPQGLRIRPYDIRSEGDTAAVVRLLARAYPDVAAGFMDGLEAARGTDWFRPEDLLLLEPDGPDGGPLLAVHWMKRRGGGTGEVYNLAVDPDAQGHGHGALLLDAGLAHLARVGCDEVVLWVDAANPRALALYRSRGFTPRWDDVSLVG